MLDITKLKHITRILVKRKHSVAFRSFSLLSDVCYVDRVLNFGQHTLSKSPSRHVAALWATDEIHDQPRDYKRSQGDRTTTRWRRELTKIAGPTWMSVKPVCYMIVAVSTFFRSQRSRQS